MADRKHNVRDTALFGAEALAGLLVAAPALRRWYNTWGATEEEVEQALPGDELVPEPKLGYTRALTVRAPAGQVWPWLAQMGQGRGGLYSYDWLENLVGCAGHQGAR